MQGGKTPQRTGKSCRESRGGEGRNQGRNPRTFRAGERACRTLENHEEGGREEAAFIDAERALQELLERGFEGCGTEVFAQYAHHLRSGIRAFQKGADSGRNRQRTTVPPHHPLRPKPGMPRTEEKAGDEC